MKTTKTVTVGVVTNQKTLENKVFTTETSLTDGVHWKQYITDVLNEGNALVVTLNGTHVWERGPKWLIDPELLSWEIAVTLT